MHEETDLQLKILIVDDDKIIADVLRDFLSRKEREVEVCYDGVTAIEHIQRNSYDVIVVDLVMPKVGGLDVLKYAKKVNPEVIVIIITGYASLETAMLAVKEGAYDYVVKPCKLDEIEIVIENATEKISLNRQNKELIIKLKGAYYELMKLKERKVKNKETANLKFFSSTTPSLRYLYDRNSSSNSFIDKLQALSSLKERGMLTKSEFDACKKHLLETLKTNTEQAKANDV